MNIKAYSASDISDEKIDGFLEQKESFSLIDVKHQGATVAALEQKLKKLGMRYRVYTKGRSVASAALVAAPFAIPALGLAAGLVSVTAGMVAGGRIAAHNIKTRKPDYKIAKNPATKTITITYQGDK